MTTRFQVAKTLAKQSLVIINQNKRLLLFPLVNTILLIGFLLLIFIPIEQIETLALKTGHLSAQQYIIFFTLLFGFFLGMHLINTFSSAALTAGALLYMETKSVSLLQYLKKIFANAHLVLAWVFFMSSIGILIRICESWITNWHEKPIADRLLNKLPWLMGSFLAIPVVIAERKNPMRALKKSATLMLDNWGFVTHSRISMGGTLVLIKIATFIPLLLGAYFGGKFNLYLGSIITTLLFFGINIVDSAVRIILTSALYLYAIDPRKTDHFFNNSLLKNAFYCPKKRL